MSNLSDISTQLAVPQTEAFKLVGNLIGSLADVSGAVGAVVGLIDLFEFVERSSQRRTPATSDSRSRRAFPACKAAAYRLARSAVSAGRGRSGPESSHIYVYIHYSRIDGEGDDPEERSDRKRRLTD